MYANLRVDVIPIGQDTGETFYAWTIEVEGSRAIIRLDSNDGTSSSAAPAGSRDVDLNKYSVVVGADW